jgi:hypothetical protein
MVVVNKAMIFSLLIVIVSVFVVVISSNVGGSRRETVDGSWKKDEALKAVKTADGWKYQDRWFGDCEVLTSERIRTLHPAFLDEADFFNLKVSIAEGVSEDKVSSAMAVVVACIYDLLYTRLEVPDYVVYSYFEKENAKDMVSLVSKDTSLNFRGKGYSFSFDSIVVKAEKKTFDGYDIFDARLSYTVEGQNFNVSLIFVRMDDGKFRFVSSYSKRFDGSYDVVYHDLFRG